MDHSLLHCSLFIIMAAKQLIFVHAALTMATCQAELHCPPGSVNWTLALDNDWPAHGLSFHSAVTLSLFQQSAWQAHFNALALFLSSLLTTIWLASMKAASQETLPKRIFAVQQCHTFNLCFVIFVPIKQTHFACDPVGDITRQTFRKPTLLSSAHSSPPLLLRGISNERGAFLPVTERHNEMIK